MIVHLQNKMRSSTLQETLRQNLSTGGIMLDNHV